MIEGDEISFAGPSHLAPPAADIINVPVVMPGMWDAHCHFFGITEAHLHLLATEPAPIRALRSVGDAYAALMAGFTSVREVGGLGLALAAAINEGSIVGPNI